MTRRLTRDHFISRAREVHGDRYSYEDLKYVSNAEKVKISCRIHGDFEQRAKNHLRGVGCPKCGAKIMRAFDMVRDHPEQATDEDRALAAVTSNEDWQRAFSILIDAAGGLAALVQKSYESERQAG